MLLKKDIRQQLLNPGRRHFVKGLAMGGAVAGLGLGISPSLFASKQSQIMPRSFQTCRVPFWLISALRSLKVRSLKL